MPLKKKLLKYRLLILIVLIPSVLVIIYYSVIASDKYLSTSEISVKDVGINNPDISGVAFLSSFGSADNQDKLYLLSYITSLDMMLYLQKTIDIKKMYSDDHIDYLNRLKPDETQEDFYKYFKKHVDVYLDPQTTLLIIKVYAYRAEDAKNILDHIVSKSDTFINELSQKTAKDQLKFSENELNMKFEEYVTAKNNVLNYQSAVKSLNPSKVAVAMETFIQELKMKLTQKEIELEELRTFLNEDSFKIQTVKNEIKAINKQVIEENDKVLSGGGDQLNIIAANYKELELKLEFAQKKYTLALASHENTELETRKKMKSLVIVQKPSMPEDSLYPKRVNNILSKIILFMIIFGIIKLTLLIIDDNRV